jgi:carbamoyltransferase
MRNYVGLACSMHDPALAIVNSRGELVFAEAAERFLQNKMAFNSPPDDFIRTSRLVEAYCEDGADLVVANSWQSVWIRRRHQFLAPLEFCVRLADRFSSRDGFFKNYVPSGKRLRFEQMRWAVVSLENSVSQATTNLRARALLDNIDYACRPSGAGAAPHSHRDGIQTEAPLKGLAGRKVFFTDFDHHLTHAAAACYASPFSEAACAVVDGRGEWRSAAFYVYRNGRLSKIKAPPSIVSLGLFYGFLCLACGFDPAKGEEWKVMGLSAYGTSHEELYEKLRSPFGVKGLQFVRSGPGRSFAENLSELRAYDRADVAFAGQRVFEELMCELLGNLFRLGVSENLVLAGGCGLNSSCNGLILSRTGFERLFVFSAPADDGNAAGAAWLAFQKDHPDWQPAPEPQSPYLGSPMSQAALDRLLTLGRVRNLSRLGPRIHAKTAQLLAEGKIVAWIQGRAEFGPRALGNRSILADPRRPDMKDLINQRVKFREEFRPFAPSILHEHGPDYFEDYQESPYMERTLRFKPSAREKVPAVVHVNGTGRLQTVKRQWNEDFHELITQFHQITGIPLLLNTSLNIMGKPLIHSVEDAVGIFYTTGLDALVIGDVLIEK